MKVTTSEAFEGIDRLAMARQPELWYEWYEVSRDVAEIRTRGDVFEGGRITNICLGADRDFQPKAYIEIIKGIEVARDGLVAAPPVVRRKKQ